METKLLAAVCALLVLNLGSTGHGENHTSSPVSTSKPGEGADVLSPVGGLVPGSTPDPTNHSQGISDTDPTINGTSSLSSNTTAGNQTIPMAHKPKEDNATVTPVTTSVPEKNESTTSQLPSQPPVVLSESHSSTSVPPHSPSVTPPLTTPSLNHSNTLNHSVSLAPGSFSTSTPSSASTQPPKQQTPKMTPTTTTTVPTTRSSSTSSSSSSYNSISSQPSTKTPQPSTTPVNGSVVQLKSTTTPLSNTSVQTRNHAESPSQLNMGGDSANSPPTLDPLLAGLVSAFILTAIIITLLLFLKLRRRSNRPEFRRLQDLPMDDMMEDTPLSMYSY